MKAFFAGLGAGYALGTLIAPKPGAEARQDLKRQAGELRNIAGEQLERVKQAVGDPRDLLNKVKTTAQPYVDQAQEAVSAATEQFKNTAKAVASKAGIGPLLMLNTASRDDLMGVYGIGPVLADKIIRGRPYTSEREVVDRDIIPESTFKELARSLKSA